MVSKDPEAKPYKPIYKAYEGTYWHSDIHSGNAFMSLRQTDFPSSPTHGWMWSQHPDKVKSYGRNSTIYARGTNRRQRTIMALAYSP